MISRSKLTCGFSVQDNFSRLSRVGKSLGWQVLEMLDWEDSSSWSTSVITSELNACWEHWFWSFWVFRILCIPRSHLTLFTGYPVPVFSFFSIVFLYFLLELFLWLLLEFKVTHVFNNAVFELRCVLEPSFMSSCAFHVTSEEWWAIVIGLTLVNIQCHIACRYSGNKSSENSKFHLFK